MEVEISCLYQTYLVSRSEHQRIEKSLEMIITDFTDIDRSSISFSDFGVGSSALIVTIDEESVSSSMDKLE